MVGLHFHSLSENQIDDAHFDGEVHLVHTAKADNKTKYLVIGAFLEMVKYSRNVLDMLFSYNFTTARQISLGRGKINPYSLFSSGDAFFSYQGSFTTPPCTPDVEWISLMQPKTITRTSWEGFRSFLSDDKLSGQQDSYGMDSRPVQPLNGRSIKVGFMP